MNNQYTITEEQLEALVAIARWKDAAEVIAIDIKSNPAPTRLLSNNEKKGLPCNPTHEDTGNGLPGLKRIWGWINFEMSYSDYHFDETMSKIEGMVTDNIKKRQPDAFSESTITW
jgi:hypothetical protein